MSSAQRILDRLVYQREGVTAVRPSLQPRRYVVPLDGRQRRDDFLVLQALWRSLGGTGEPEPASTTPDYPAAAATAGVLTERLPARLVCQVRRTFEECVAALAFDMARAVQRALYAELQNLEDEHLVAAADVLDWADCSRRGETYSTLVVANPDHNPADPLSIPAGVVRLPGPRAFWATFGYTGCVDIFSAPFWRAARCDLYGGPPWVEIAHQGRELLRLTKEQGTRLVELAGQIARLYDARHNTGYLFAKATTAPLCVDGDTFGRLVTSPQGNLSSWHAQVSPTVGSLLQVVADHHA